MNPENTSKLLSTYPLLYRNLRDQQFECGEGWFDLVRKVSAEIEATAALEGIPKTPKDWPPVGILKQKVGTLRVQFHGMANDAIEAVATKASEQSKEICKLCGAPAHCGSERELTRWVETLCVVARHKLPTLRDEECPVKIICDCLYHKGSRLQIAGYLESRNLGNIPRADNTMP